MAMRIYGDLASTPALYWSGGVAVKKLESIADFRKDWRIVNKIRIASDSFNNAQLATIYYKVIYSIPHLTCIPHNELIMQMSSY